MRERVRSATWRLFQRLSALPVASGSRGPILDNISLSSVAAVPEPGAFAMFAAGLGLMGLLRRRFARPRVVA